MQSVNDFKHYFYSKRGFRAIPGSQINDNGKRKFSYTAIEHELSEQDYTNHFRTEIGLTPSPIINGNECCWGAIDIDSYGLEVEAKKKIVAKGKELKLVPAESKSGGLHLYCFAQQEVQARNMRGYLYDCLEKLGLPRATEVFPKQDQVDDKAYGNGITLPYRQYQTKPGPSPKGLAILNGAIIQITPEQFVNAIKLNELKASHFKQYNNIDLKEEPETVVGDIGSIQDPEMKKLTAVQILSKIRKDKMTINDDSYFDDLITLFVGKSVANFSTDQEILGPLLDLPDTGADRDYFNRKIQRSRSALDIEDPDVSRKNLLTNCIYIKQRDKFFDLTSNEEYKKEAIDFTYARLFNKQTPSSFIKKNPKRIAVEEWLYEPMSYNKENKLIKQDGKLYLNSYEPCQLESEQGDTQLWDQLLNHYFNDQMKYKEHFLDWLAFQIQNPGVKIRHALILVSTQYQVGKGSMWRAIKQIFGSHNAKEIDVGQALDKSKGFLTNSQLVLIDEMQSAGKFDEKMKLLNDLKRIITEDHISTRALYIDYKIVKSCTNYLLFTNHTDALSLPNNEVRYWVYLSERSRMGDKFYEAYHSWIDGGGAKAILYELKNRDISDSFNPKGIAPDTPYREQMTKGGEHPLTKIIRALYDEFEYPFEEKQIIIGSTELYTILRDMRIGGNFRINDIAKALEQIGGRPLGQCRIMIDGKMKKPSLYLIRGMDKYIGRSPQELAEELYIPAPLKNFTNHF
tara:strand:- start:1811 stop:4030 length:2220 start_codon:yes stop_codon:yes gene_type:complete